jgi:phage terminase large subunit-like protein
VSETRRKQVNEWYDNTLYSFDQIRRTITEYNFVGQYQQTPAPLGGGIVKEAYFKRYRPEDLPGRWDQTIQSWDSASKATELSSYSVCTTWGIKQERIYLLHVLRKRMGSVTAAGWVSCA